MKTKNLKAFVLLNLFLSVSVAYAQNREALGQLIAIDVLNGTAGIQALAPAITPRPTPVSFRLTPAHKKNALPLKLENNPLMVVHTSREFDEEAMVAEGVNEMVAKFKEMKHPVIYLVNDQSAKGYKDWYTKDRSPDYELFSEGGEHNLPLAADEVTIAGGYFGSYDTHRGCHTLATRDAIRMHFELSQDAFTVNLPVRAIYFYDGSSDQNTRKHILGFDAAITPLSEMQEMGKYLADAFFLTDNFSDTLQFGHPYFGGSDRLNKKYRDGKDVDIKGYTFEIFFDGVSSYTFGTGPRKVNLKFMMKTGL